MAGATTTDDKKKKKQDYEKKCDNEVKITLFGSKKDSKTKKPRDNEKGHNLNVVNYKFRNKYKPYHDREYGVSYHKDNAAYSYRGYDIKEPKVKICSVVQEVTEQPMRWIQYMTHSEKHPAIKPPKMYYFPNDNTFIQIVLMSLLFCLIITMCSSILGLYVKRTQRIFKEPYNYIWMPGIFGLMFTFYMVLCSACSRIFPFSFILLLVNVVSMCWLCMYLTILFETHAVYITFIPIILVVMFLIVCAFCEYDFRKFKLLLLTGLLAFLFAYIMIWILIMSNENLLPYLPRRENMMILGIVVYCVSLVLILQMIIENRTIRLTDDDYAIGTLMLYMSIPCTFMKLLYHIGLYDEKI